MQTYKVTVNTNEIRWYKPDTNQLHKLDGPAAITANGDKHWYQDDQLHRLDGPAIERINGSKYWYVKGEKLTEQQFLARTQPSNCDGKTVTIDGREYTLQLKN